MLAEGGTINKDARRQRRDGAADNVVDSERWFGEAETEEERRSGV